MIKTLFLLSCFARCVQTSGWLEWKYSVPIIPFVLGNPICRYQCFVKQRIPWDIKNIPMIKHVSNNNSLTLQMK